MSAEQNKAAIRRIPLEAFNEGKLHVLDEVIQPGYIEHVQPPPGFPASIEGLKQFVTMLRAAFPDFRYTVEDEITEGDNVVLRLTAHGTQRGAFMGAPPTGKHVTWSEIHFARVVDGKLAEHWGQADQLGMLQQLGLAPMPGQSR